MAGTGWGVAQLIETGSGDAVTPQVAFDASGNAIAVWAQDNGINYGIYVSRYVAGIAAGARHNGLRPAAATPYNHKSTSTLVAMQSRCGLRKMVSTTAFMPNCHVAGTGWGTAQRIETSSGYANGPQIAVDAGGNAIAVWAQNDGGR